MFDIRWICFALVVLGVLYVAGMLAKIRRDGKRDAAKNRPPYWD